MAGAIYMRTRKYKRAHIFSGARIYDLARAIYDLYTRIRKKMRAHIFSGARIYDLARAIYYLARAIY